MARPELWGTFFDVPVRSRHVKNVSHVKMMHKPEPDRAAAGRERAIEPTLPSPAPPGMAQAGSTIRAPTFRAPAEGVPANQAPAFPAPGQRIDDFELLRMLGEGAFGKVFLARQISLDRQVALKVTANWGNEARTLASLEHDCIVHVFSEMVDRQSNLRLMCMQYVPGTTLQEIIRGLENRPRCSL